MSYLVVFIGSGIGGALRYGVGVLAVQLFGLSFPIGTMAINVVGSFAMALLADYFSQRTGVPATWQLFLTTGIVGGFTTFSTFSFDAVTLCQRGQLGAAAIYVMGSVVLSLASFFVGLWVIRALIDAGFGAVP